MTDSLEGTLDSPGGASGKEPACQCRRHKRCRFDPWVGKIPWRRAWQPTPLFLPGESPRTEEPGGLTKSRTPLKRLSMQGSRDRRSQHIRLTPSQQDCVHPLHFLSATTLCFLFTISKTTHSHMPLMLHYFNGTFLFCFLQS